MTDQTPEVSIPDNAIHSRYLLRREGEDNYLKQAESEFGHDSSKEAILEIARLRRENDSLRQKVNKDAKTALLTKEAGYDAINEKLRKLNIMLPTSQDAYALMIDVDYFKSINDNLFHETGDKVIEDIGRRLRGLIREDDLAFRYGGDEFGVLITAPNNEIAQAVAERIRATLYAGINIVVQDATPDGKGLDPRPSVSIDIAKYEPNTDITPGKLFKAADSALYESKNTQEDLSNKTHGNKVSFYTGLVSDIKEER